MLNSTVITATAITPIEYCGLQQAYDHFNFELLDGKLPDVMITLQRHAHSAGYFSPDRFSGRADNFVKHELNLNPDGFPDRSDEQICSTLAHEMVHVWQEVFGKPSKGGYHNRQWAEQMKAIGLQPSASGLLGGKETGPQVSHYILADGRFARAYSALAATGRKLNLERTRQRGQPNGGQPNGGKDGSKQNSLAWAVAQTAGAVFPRSRLPSLRTTPHVRSADAGHGAGRNPRHRRNPRRRQSCPL